MEGAAAGAELARAARGHAAQRSDLRSQVEVRFGAGPPEGAVEAVVQVLATR